MLPESKSQRRLSILQSHLRSGQEDIEFNPTKSTRHFVPFTSVVDANHQSSLPNPRQRELKWNGWGFNHTEFLQDGEGCAHVTGDAYPLSGQRLPHFRPFWEKEIELNMDVQSTPQSLDEMLRKMPEAHLYQPFLDDLEKKKPYKHCVHDKETRLFHSRGHSVQEIFQLRHGAFNRYVDLVVYPTEHEHVEEIVKLAVKHSKEVCIIPFGGGTTVTQSLLVPENEKRMVISLDTTLMNRILWVDKKKMMACIQAGVTGIQCEQELEKYGVTLGHEPDSYELSTMGGWVATRASGMKKNKYGNIEDFLLDATVVTPVGTVHHGNHERKSTGPDLNQVFMGSEGALGVVTQAVCRIQNMPKVKRYGSIVFPDFQSGINTLREVHEAGINPAGLRLVDNVNFQMGSSLKTELHGFANLKRHAMDVLKKQLLTKVKGFDLNKVCAATFVLEEDDEKTIQQKEDGIISIAEKHGGLNGGEEPGRQGFLLTYVIAYLRDYAANYTFLCESFESFVPWDRINECQKKVKARIIADTAKCGIVQKPWICCRVSQSYQTGVCLYFYFGIVYNNIDDPVGVFSKIEEGARDIVLDCHGSLSHHHGIGKLRSKWMPSDHPQVVNKNGFTLLRKIKEAFDPDNVFANGNWDSCPSIISTCH